MGKELPYTYARFIGSGMFTLLAGQSDSKPFCVHKQLLAEMSPELRAHVFNEMKEGRENRMEMWDVSAQTMCQFLEFCYTGDYAESVDFRDNDVDGIGDQGEGGEGVQGPESEEAVGTSYGIEELFGGVEHELELGTVAEARARALIPHAKLYVLGDMYNISRLKDLALGKIREIILGLEDTGHRLPWVANVFVDLMKYACKNLPEQAEARKIDPLMECLAGYAAWELFSFHRNPDFLELLSTSGRKDFTKAFLCGVRRNEGSMRAFISRD